MKPTVVVLFNISSYQLAGLFKTTHGFSPYTLFIQALVKPLYLPIALRMHGSGSCMGYILLPQIPLELQSYMGSSTGIPGQDWHMSNLLNPPKIPCTSDTFSLSVLFLQVSTCDDLFSSFLHYP